MTTSHSLMQVPDEELDDLAHRLRNTRWAKAWPLPAWQAGTDLGELRRLAAYWADGFDWRRSEREINELPSHFARIAETQVHYLRFDAERPDALPLLLINGWPSSFLEFVELARRLSTPSAYGGRPEDAFTVIIPSLPGFGFSEPRASLDDTMPTHEMFHRLMTQELGFDRYGVHGGDLGSAFAGWLAQAHPEAVVGLHLMDVDRTPFAGDVQLTSDEQRFQESVAAWSVEHGAYAHQQRTRPLTLAHGLSDSPVGLLAWIVEKYRAWSDCDGDLSSRFSDDFLLTQASLYWFTNSISTSFRDYYERGNGFTPRLQRVVVPTGVTSFAADIGEAAPRSYVERRYHLIRYAHVPRGGHFAAVEEPAALAGQMIAFFQLALGESVIE